MKLVKIFAVFAALHVCGWAAGHVYMSHNPRSVLLVADTSFAMKSKFPVMQDWIEQYQSGARYKKILVASDKALLGDLADLPSISQVFRANYGRIKEESLQKFEGIDTTERYLLSDGSLSPAGWTQVKF